jgi:hypothetical protein
MHVSALFRSCIPVFTNTYMYAWAPPTLSSSFADYLFLYIEHTTCFTWHRPVWGVQFRRLPGNYKETKH